MSKLPRPTLKVKLPASAESGQVMRVVADWKANRQMSAHMVQAVLLYSALLQGDTSRLRRAFPFIANALGGLGFGAAALPTAPLAAQQSAEEVAPEDFGASLGLDDLEF
ncbi:hypothetical protein FBQ95_16985 [Chloroflexi bacterium CFX3]|nr:hypothetical protein [Chloroflexi bacterium CFX3]